MISNVTPDEFSGFFGEINNIDTFEIPKLWILILLRLLSVIPISWIIVIVEFIAFCVLCCSYNDLVTQSNFLAILLRFNRCIRSLSIVDFPYWNLIHSVHANIQVLVVSVVVIRTHHSCNSRGL